MHESQSYVVASELIRALRGARSQRTFAKLLGFARNPVADWEAGRRFPSVHVMFQACALAEVDVEQAVWAFHPEASHAFAPDSPHAVGAWLDALRGTAPHIEIAHRIPTTRSSVSRWLSGDVVLRLPEFIALLQAITGRLPDFIEHLVPAAALPSLAAQQRSILEARHLARSHPWTLAFVAAIDTALYRSLDAHPRGLLASIFEVSIEEEDAGIEALVTARVLVRDGLRLRLDRPLTLDLTGDPERARDLRRHWLAVSMEQVDACVNEDIFSYNVFSVSRTDFERLREMHAAFYREVRQIIAASTPTDVVAMYGTQLFEWPMPLRIPMRREPATAE
jgi:transcriptional regulator with XRE-family HTH domain